MAEEKELTQEQVKEFAEFLKENKFSWTTYKELLNGMKDMSEDEIQALDANGELSALMQKLNDNPRFKNYTKRQEIAKGIEGGVQALQTLSNISTARRQIDESKRMEEELIDPSAPPTTPKSQELADATEMARRDMGQPIKEIDPILQRNMDLLNQGFNVAETTSGGQAGVSGSMKQAAINQARSANQQMIPAIEGIRRQQKEAYNRLIAAGISEDDMRFKQEMQKYQVAENRYLAEAQAIGGLRAAGEQNLFGQQQDLFGQLGSAISPAVNFNYGGTKAADVAAAPNPTMNYQFQAPQYQQIANNPYDTGVMGDNINQATNRYTAIGNLGKGFQAYGNKLDFNLEESMRGLGNWKPNLASTFTR